MFCQSKNTCDYYRAELFEFVNEILRGVNNDFLHIISFREGWMHYTTDVLEKDEKAAAKVLKTVIAGIDWFDISHQRELLKQPNFSSLFKYYKREFRTVAKSNLTRAQFFELMNLIYKNDYNEYRPFNPTLILPQIDSRYSIMLEQLPLDYMVNTFI